MAKKECELAELNEQLQLAKKNEAQLHSKLQPGKNKNNKPLITCRIKRMPLNKPESPLRSERRRLIARQLLRQSVLPLQNSKPRQSRRPSALTRFVLPGFSQ